MATALDARLRERKIAAAGAERDDLEVLPLKGRGADGAGSDVVLLAVPDAAIAEAAALIVPGPTVGHLSGATPIDVIERPEVFGLHPMLTVLGPETEFVGASAAIAGSTPRARATAEHLAAALGLAGVQIAESDRAAYHAACSVAANFLMAVEGFAEELAATAGVPRAALVPLVGAAATNWADRGAAAALTGPIARGDDATVARQRGAVAERLPHQLALFDALTDATRRLARPEPEQETA